MSTPRDQIANKEAKGEHYLLEVDNPVVLPVGKKVRILLTSTDVIHTWWVPQFGVKRDAIPGFLRETWVKIEQPGTYRGQCAELCGKDHGFMPVVVACRARKRVSGLGRREKDSTGSCCGRIRQDLEQGRPDGRRQGRLREAMRGLPPARRSGFGTGIPGARRAARSSPARCSRRRQDCIKDSHVDRVLNGKEGTAMQAFRDTLTDTELAAVITYERNSFGNKKGDMIQPAQIKSLR
jgi:cytochrome c oxidase subunit 2